MNTAAEILSIAKIERSKILKYHYSKSKWLYKSISHFKKHELNALLFHTIESPAELCKFFKTPFYKLEHIINNPAYKQYSIAKKKGGSRQIFEPSIGLKRLQKQLNYFLQACYLCIKPTEVFGFVVNPHYLGTYCNIAENAKPHTGKKYVLNIDLKDFFPGITAPQVKQLFTSDFFNFDEQIATALTLLTVFDGRLPIGAPTSPVISNFICYHLDNDLKQFCSNAKLTYTRYADDLTFSSDFLITSDIILDLINLIKKNNFQINFKKLRLTTANRRQTVTGLTINQKVNIDRKLLKKIRAMLHDLTTNGIDKATQRHFNLEGEIEMQYRAKFIQRLEGYINFTGQVKGKHDALYKKQKDAFDRMFEKRNNE